MAKALDAPYEAGRRGAGWLKIKRAHTLDLVVLAAEWGSGRRRRLAVQPAPRRARPGERRLRDARQDLQGPDRRDARVADARAPRARDAPRRVDGVRAPRAGGRDRLQRRAGKPALSRAAWRCASRASRAIGPTSAPRRPTPSTPCAPDLRARASREERLEDWLAFIERQHPQAIALGLERVAEVLARNADSLQCPVITVGGTNGKGSTCAMLESILRAAGYRTGLYTSPHLVRYNERVRIAGAEVDDAALVAGFEAVEKARGDMPLTYFEFGTLAALWFFQRRGNRGAGSRPGRSARRGERARRRLRGADERRHRPRRLPRPGSRVDRPREGWHLPRRTAGGDRRARPAALGARGAGNEAPFWQGLRLQRPQATSGAIGVRAASAPVLRYPALRGAIQLRNAPRRCARSTRSSCRSPCRTCGAALPRSRCPGASRCLPGRPQVILDVAHNVEAARARRQPRRRRASRRRPSRCAACCATRTSAACCARCAARHALAFRLACRAARRERR